MEEVKSLFVDAKGVSQCPTCPASSSSGHRVFATTRSGWTRHGGGASTKSDLPSREDIERLDQILHARVDLSSVAVHLMPPETREHMATIEMAPRLLAC